MDRWIVGDEIKCWLPLIVASRGFLVGEVTAKAVSAMNGAHSGGDHQDTRGVFVQQSGSAFDVLIAHRILPVTRRLNTLITGREDLQQQGICGIPGLHPRDELARDE